MTIAVLLILLVLWLAVLAPPVIRFFSGEARSSDSVGDFNQTLSTLGRTNGHRGPRGVTVVGGMSPAQRRRRDVLLALVGAVILTLLLAVLTGSRLAWGLQLLVDVALVGYVALLVQYKNRAAERRAKVAYLPARAVARPTRARRSAVN